MNGHRIFPVLYVQTKPINDRRSFVFFFFFFKWLNYQHTITAYVYVIKFNLIKYLYYIIFILNNFILVVSQNIPSIFWTTKLNFFVSFRYFQFIFFLFYQFINTQHILKRQQFHLHPCYLVFVLIIIIITIELS